jgi:succinate dehydrogenase / fumarate reductase cytochrome b subunit
MVLILNTWPVKTMGVFFIWALIHHLIAGLRHLLLDLQIGNDLIMARLSSKTVLLVSFVLTAIVVYWI